MKAVILAAGKGTRMKEITKEIPKPMVLINGKPILEYLVTYIKCAGITEFGIVVGYKQYVVQNYLKDGSTFGISITYIEQKVQDGTGSAVHLAQNFTDDEPFFLTFGDIITPAENYRGMIDFFSKHSCDALLGLNTLDDPHRGAAVYTDEDNNIIRMVEKTPKNTSKTNLINAGLMILSPSIFSYTPRIQLSSRGEYELTDVFGMMCEEGCSIKGYVLSGYWKDVGTPDDLVKTHKMIAS